MKADGSLLLVHEGSFSHVTAQMFLQKVNQVGTRFVVLINLCS